MKKITIYSLAFLMLGIGTLNSGCMGSWGLTKKLYNWNDGATGNKFVDNGLFWLLCFIPVYEISLFVDFVILNLIQFWTGSNPISMAPGEVETAIVKGKDGNQYQMTVTQNRFEAVALTGKNKGEKTALVYTPQTQTWSVEKGETVSPLMTVHPELGKVEVFNPNGNVQLFDASALAVQGMVLTHQ